MVAAARLQRKFIQSGNLFDHLFEVVVYLQHTLDRIRVLVGVNIREAGVEGQGLAKARVVFHGTGTLGYSAQRLSSNTSVILSMHLLMREVYSGMTQL